LCQRSGEFFANGISTGANVQNAYVGARPHEAAFEFVSPAHKAFPPHQ
jgi:hypothetical protein